MDIDIEMIKEVLMRPSFTTPAALPTADAQALVWIIEKLQEIERKLFKPSGK